ncbi:prephenate dehydratase [Nowakowskiella sp. JEL0407]|nr:prephenate dehydratase [Nowakowskiella sp. JEL0407]
MADKKTTVAFLGPWGSYSHQAISLLFPDASAVALLPAASIPRCLDQLDSTDYVLVPIENSSFGVVIQALDKFIHFPLLHSSFLTTYQISLSKYLVIHHCLLSSATNLSDIVRVYSHPQGLGQVSNWLDKHLPNAERKSVDSTSKAAELCRADPQGAAVCSEICKDIYGLNVLAKNIEDASIKDGSNSSTNTTRFFLLSKTINYRPPNTTQETLPFLTFLSITVNQQQPGALCDALAILKQKNLNLTKIDSRPSGRRKWHYIFFLELEGHFNDTNVHMAIVELQKICFEVKVFGSYQKVAEEFPDFEADSAVIDNGGVVIA